jgi:prepilin-type N-terminal cleavage/methylation domain-containing protein/prepilin-type processing-associated H-X9-DG protein
MHMPRKTRPHALNRAFTIIEMLVVIALIGVLTGMISVVLIKARQRSVQVECAENLHQIGRAVTAFMLDNGSAYPQLYSDTDGNSVASLSDATITPWWLRLHNDVMPNAALEPDDLPDQLPTTLKIFHCRMAKGAEITGTTDLEKLTSLNASISYGLNFDVKKADATPYECVAKSDGSYPDLDTANGKAPATSGDRESDPYTRSDIKRPSEFVLISEADSDNGAGGRIRCNATSNATHAAPVIGRHAGEANVLFADIHVEMIQVEGDDSDALAWTVLLNQNTPLWTLPND